MRDGSEKINLLNEIGNAKFDLLSEILRSREAEKAKTDEEKIQKHNAYYAKKREVIERIGSTLTSVLVTLVKDIKSKKIDLNSREFDILFGKHVLFEIESKDDANTLYENIKEVRSTLINIAKDYLGDGARSIIMDITCERPYERIIKRSNLTLVIGTQVTIEDRKPEYIDDFYPEDSTY